MKITQYALCALATMSAFQASATTLIYEVDFSQSQGLDQTSLEDICLMPLTIQMDASEDLATTVMEKALKSGAKNIKIQTIQSSSGNVSGGDLKEPYMGDYRTRVAITRIPGFAAAYKEGIFQRVEITTYGSTSAPKAFQIHSELLNYRESAELAEMLACPDVSYKLK